jgi:hypothetical protein
LLADAAASPAPVFSRELSTEGSEDIELIYIYSLSYHQVSNTQKNSAPGNDGDATF